MCRSEVLGGKAVSTADNLDAFSVHEIERSNNVEVKWLTYCTCFLSSVENCNSLYSLRKSCYEVLSREWSVESDLHETNLSTASVEVINCPVECVSCGTHYDYNVCCIWSTDIVEEVILSACDCVDLVHVLLDDCRNCIEVLVDCLSSLEVNVFVLSCNLCLWMLRALCSSSESLDVLLFDDCLDVVVGNLLYLLDLVGCSESVEEVEERNLRLKSGKMSNECHIHCLLD